MLYDTHTCVVIDNLWVVRCSKNPFYFRVTVTTNNRKNPAMTTIAHKNYILNYVMWDSFRENCPTVKMS